MKNIFKIYKDSIKILKYLHSTNHNVIPLMLLRALVQSIYPYVNIIFTAIIIDKLLGKQWELAIIFSIVMIVVQFIVGTMMEIIGKFHEVMTMTINRECSQRLCERALTLDYESLEDKKSRQEFESAEFNQARNGGFGWLMIEYSDACSYFLSILISIGFVFTLCFTIGKSSNEFIGYIVSPIGSIVCIFLLISTMFFIYKKMAEDSSHKMLEVFDKQMENEQELSYFMDEVFLDYTKAKEIRLYNMKDMLLQLNNFRKIKNMNHSYNVLKFQYRINSTGSIVNDILNIFVYIIIAFKVMANAITIGEFTKYVGSFQQMNVSIRGLIEKTNHIQVLNSYLSYFVDYVEKENKLNTGTLPIEKRNDNHYEIEFHNVSFRYPQSNIDVLKNISLKITLKDKLAVVGKNGAGKTTFIKLLCRLYDPTEGYITLNNIDIRKYDYIEYMSLFSVVFQDFGLFAFSLKENIAAKMEMNIDEIKVWQCLDKAGVKERVDALKLKLDTPLMKYDDEGVDFSGGESQKLAIARALYKDAPFVVLDEPTAALDPISEYEIYSRFNDLVDDKTSIFISHRMSSCRFCDDIIVFDKGEVIQRGNHDSLISDIDNVYARLWNAQAKYYA